MRRRSLAAQRDGHAQPAAAAAAGAYGTADRAARRQLAGAVAARLVHDARAGGLQRAAQVQGALPFHLGSLGTTRFAYPCLRHARAPCWAAGACGSRQGSSPAAGAPAGALTTPRAAQTRSPPPPIQQPCRVLTTRCARLAPPALAHAQWQPGVQGAADKLESFLLGRLPNYEHDRAKVDRASTSQLSPWVHIGSISVRYVFYRVRRPRGNRTLPACLP